jgi:hypothetical protein
MMNIPAPQDLPMLCGARVKLRAPVERDKQDRLTAGSEFPENDNEKPDKEDERDDDGEVFSPLFVAEALLVATLTLILGQFIPFFEVECH